MRTALHRYRAIAVTIRELFRADRRVAWAVSVLVVVSAVLPVATTLATGRLLGAIPSAVARSEGFALLAPLVLAVGALYVSGQLLAALQRPVFFLAGSRFTMHLRGMVEDATVAPAGIAHLEDPSCADEIALVDSVEGANWPPAYIVSGLAVTAVGLFTGVSHAVLLGRFAWWAPVLIAASFWPLRRWIVRDVAVFVEAAERSSGGLRRSMYLRELATGPQAAKEVRIFGLSAFVVERFALQWRDAMKRLWQTRNAGRGLIIQAALAQALAYGTVFAFIGRDGLGRAIDIGEVAIFAQAALAMSQMAYGGDMESAMRHGAPFVERATRLRARVLTSSATLRGCRLADDLPKSGIAFEGVRFAYPGTARHVLDGLDLVVRAGQSLAIVGVNGAGKTTLIKLLARLYDPTRGRIVVDGVDLAELEPASWRARIAVIFQDFVRYPLSLQQNVGLGARRLIEDQNVLADALTSAGGSELLDRLGWKTPLSPAFVDGVDLSGGEWQKVALARAMAAVRGGASVLVLDEPTAHLDVRAEAELFDRFLELTHGLTTILLSHRFSSVRRADRICVVHGGRVIEEGSHDELVAIDGHYASMFRQQARQFGLQIA